jgi:twitching motility two-component system response regulator PilH
LLLFYLLLVHNSEQEWSNQHGWTSMAKVLIVDDSPAQIFSLKTLVENWGHQTISAESGNEALLVARQEIPDVILMDVVMPGMSGFQATRKLSKDLVTCRIPVIFVSTKDGEADRIWGMRQGASAYVTKPVNPEKLMNAISDAIAA